MKYQNTTYHCFLVLFPCKPVLDVWLVNLGTRASEHEGCNWGMQMIDGCSLELCVATPSVPPSDIVLQK